MAELKAEILALTVPYQKADKDPSAWLSFRRNGTVSTFLCTIFGFLLSFIISYSSPDLSKKLLTIATSTLFGSFFGSICQLLFNLWQRYSLDLALKNSIICIDDVERAEEINPYDILHFAAWLRDNRNCKVALLLNANHIDIENKEKFERAIEKGTNQFLKLNLTPQEAGEIWKKIINEKKEKLSKKWEGPFLKITAELGICNIRVLEHLSTALNRWYDYLKPHEESIGYKDLQKYIFLGTIITGWGHFEPDLCLSWDDIRKRIFLQKMNEEYESNSIILSKSSLLKDDFIKKEIEALNKHSKWQLDIVENDKKRTYSAILDQTYKSIQNIISSKNPLDTDWLYRTKTEKIKDFSNIIFYKEYQTFPFRVEEIHIIESVKYTFFYECYQNIQNGYLTDNNAAIKIAIKKLLRLRKKQHEYINEYIEQLIQGNPESPVPGISIEIWLDLIEKKYSPQEVFHFSRALTKKKNLFQVEKENFKNLVSALKQLMKKKPSWSRHFKPLFDPNSPDYINPPKDKENS